MSTRSRRAGFSLVELTAAIAVFGIVGYTLAGSVGLAKRAQTTVSRTVDTNVAVRDASARLRAELKATGDARIALATLGDGNHSLTFQVPVEVGGAEGWGAFERRLGPSEMQQNLVDGQLRYTVEFAPNNGERRLVRQVLDDTGAVRRSEVLVRDLAPGVANAPGFAIEAVGDLWRVRITQAAREGGAARTEEFHVRTRNE
jgi:prepilin-type N-terminal cleavage/methylation domain-containing protein